MYLKYGPFPPHRNIACVWICVPPRRLRRGFRFVSRQGKAGDLGHSGAGVVFVHHKVSLNVLPREGQEAQSSLVSS